MQPSRRSFLFGRRPAGDSAWGRFCARLARSCLGRVEDGGEAGGASIARLAPARPADVMHARELCAQYGVALALAGGAPPDPGRPVLWVDPAVALTGLEPAAGAPGLWRAEAGCPVGELAAAGLAQFGGAEPGMTLAAWLAGPAGRLCPARDTAASGVAALDAVLADGERATLGPFGEHDTLPLRGIAMQRLVPRLFELAAGADAQACLAAPRWPARVRLDALRPADGRVNLGQLLLGHGGTLAWVESALLRPAAQPPDAGTGRDAADDGGAGEDLHAGGTGGGGSQGGQHAAAALQHEPPDLQAAAARLDARAKALFDPAGALPPLPAV